VFNGSLKNIGDGEAVSRVVHGVAWVCEVKDGIELVAGPYSCFGVYSGAGAGIAGTLVSGKCYIMQDVVFCGKIDEGALMRGDTRKTVEENYARFGFMYEFVWEKTKVVSLDFVGSRVTVGLQTDPIPFRSNYLLDAGVNIYNKLDNVMEFSIDNLIDRIKERRHNMEHLVSFSGIVIKREYRIDEYASASLNSDSLFDRYKVYFPVLISDWIRPRFRKTISAYYATHIHLFCIRRTQPTYRYIPGLETGLVYLWAGSWGFCEAG
jgi:hypothetical protein